MKSFGKIYYLKAHYLLLLLLLFASHERIFVPSSALAPVEQDVLLGIKEGWNDSDLVLSSWTQDSNCSTWNGIICDENGYVIEMLLKDNQFFSSIPSSIGNLRSLEKLNLNNNSLLGPIPDSFGNLKNLIHLNLTNNQINGYFPSSILALENLQILYLGKNQLTGPLPSSIGNLTSLVYLDLSSNQFTGPIPPSIENLYNLEYLDLTTNQIEDFFPSSILALENLKYLYLGENQLTGHLPLSIDNLTNLIHLSLRNNKFYHIIPPSIGNLTNLNWLLLSNNSFSGSIPSSLSKLTKLNSLWLFMNQLSGPIPIFVGLMDSLTVLYLDSNYFTGYPIYSGIEYTMKNNCLTSVPNQKSRSECSFFFNNYYGPCERRGTCPVNASNVTDCTFDSDWVFSSCQFDLGYIGLNTYSSRSYISVLHLIIGISVAFILFLIIFAIIVWLLCRKHNRKKMQGTELIEQFHALPKKEFKNEVQKLSLKTFSLRELKSMTREFDDSMTLGSGGFGMVYKGIMPSGELYAIKKAHQMSVRSLHDFQQEVFALAQLNHFNLVKLLGYCNEAKENILIYEYVENGSLSKILCLPKEHPHFLSFEKRVQIARDCAQGLNYLHNLSNKQLIHRDVKSDNILLDSNFTAKIADFGLLKVNDQKVSTIKTSPCGTPGYLDPEYFKTQNLTNKSDVYSFGVVLLELITGKPSIFVIDDPEVPNGKLNQSLVSWARPILQSNNLDELIDPNLKEEYEPIVLQSLASLAALCLRRSQKDRPGMDEVSSRLGVMMYGKASEIQEDESYAINMEDNSNEYVLSNDGYTNSTSSISNRGPVMSRSFRPR